MNPATISGPSPEQSMTPALRMARLLGWTSFGLAAAFLLAPRRITETFNLEGKENLIRGFGVQEILAGQGALSIDPTFNMWGRAGGDVIHLATLATGLEGSRENGTRGNVLWGLGVLAAFLAIDSIVAASLHNERNRFKGEPRDYSDRSGFPQGNTRARGIARDAATPIDYRVTPPTVTSGSEGTERSGAREVEAHPS